jgi:hypothetical protein
MPLDVRINNSADADPTAGDVGVAVSGLDKTTPPAFVDGNTFNLSLGPGQALRVGGVAPTGTAGVINPISIGAVARSSAPVALANNVVGNLLATLYGALVSFPYTIPDLSWQFASAASGIVSSTTAVVLNAAGAAGVRNYLARLQLANDLLSAVTEIVILDGVTIIWRSKLQVTATQTTSIVFDPPLRGTAATSMSVQLLTSVTGGVYVNAQGFLAP